MEKNMPLRIGILTVSDRASAGEMDDLGGPAVEDALQPLAPQIEERSIVPDDEDTIADLLTAWCDRSQLDVIFTTGGTGLGPRDVTPEATLRVCRRLVPGIAETIRSTSLGQTQHAMLSRGAAGVRGSTLIINLPGSPRGAREGVEVVLSVLEHAVATL